MPAPPPESSNGMTFLTVGVVVLGALGFLYLLFGELFLVAMGVFAVIGGVGCLHYFLWGRSMSNDADPDEAKTDSDSLESD